MDRNAALWVASWAALSARRVFLAAAASLLACGCYGPSIFEDAAPESGLEFISYAGDHLWYLIDTLGSGAAAGDYDGDGDPDLFLCTGYAILDNYQEEANEYSNALWQNDGKGRFTDVTDAAGLRKSGWSNGAVFGDYDGDGDLDLFVACHGPNLLYRNDGNGKFQEVGHAAGVDDDGWGAGGSFADLDGDGDLDLYVTNYAHFDIAEQKGKVDWFDKGVLQFPQYFEPQDNKLYLNNGDGTFRDATRDAHAEGSGRSLGVVATDVDNDGDLDLFIANDVGFNDLLRNDGGKFTNVAFAAGVAANGEGQYEASMGVAAADYDGDGDMDLIVTNYAGEPNTLYQNQGDGIFRDVTKEAGLVTPMVMDCVGWGVGLHDFDLDGNLDLFVVNGHVLSGMVAWYMRHFYTPKEGEIRQMGPDAFRLGAEQPKHLFLGRGDGTFEDISEHGGREIMKYRQSRGAAFADYDGDGRLDVAVTNKNSPTEVLLNRMTPRGNWTILSLRAPPPNIFAVGARVQVLAGGKTFTRELHAGTSYLSGDDLRVHVGIGSATTLDEVTVRWPGGCVEVFRGLPANQPITLTKGSSRS
ncbi:MAG TPA: CRTAC1 family protein [Planctomycetota bacterium]|nr:CRTAC1 family protein [Planctomycetota bacterium]